MPFTILDGGSFTSTGAGAKILLPSSADYFRTWNITQIGQANPNKVVMGEWFGSKFGAGQSADGTGLKWVKTNVLLQVSPFASGGFTYVNSSPVVEAESAAAITNISRADPAVVTQANSYSENDILRIYLTIGMPQIGGMDFQISNVSGAGYDLIGLDSSAFSADATSGYTRRISKYNAVEPEALYVTKVTRGVSTVVRTSVDPGNYYVVGMKMRFSIPSSFGMTQLDGLTGTILAIDSATYELTVDIDSQSFSAFAFPAAADISAQRFATVAPAGASTKYDPNLQVYTGYNFSLQPFHSGQFVPYMYLAAGAQSPAGALNDVINWMAYKLET